MDKTQQNKKDHKLLIKVLYLTLTYIVPIFVISLKYDLIKTGNPKVKLSVIGILLVIFFVWKGWKGLVAFISKVEKPIVRKIFKIARNLIICFMLILLLELAKYQIDNLEFCIAFCGISITAGNWFYEDYVEIIKRCEKRKRQNEMVEAFEMYEKSK